MQAYGRAALRAVCVAGLLMCGLLHAQTISIAPKGYVTAVLGTGQVQFTASTTGVPEPATLLWSVGSVVGGNSTVGTISSTGLYKAPAAMTGGGMVTINVTVSGNSKVTATQYLYFLVAGPPITAASPNPLPSGTFTVSITGTGFQTGAVVFDGAVQLSTVSVSANLIKATGYQPPATSTTFYVRNPSSGPSNVLTVPVTGSTGGGGGGGGTGGGGGGGGGGTPAPVVTPPAVTLALSGQQNFTATNATGWAAVSGTITSAGAYTAPSTLPASGKDTVTATGPGGTGTATITLVSNVAPAIQTTAPTSIPLGVFSLTITGTGFTAASQAQLNGAALGTTANGNTLTVTGFAGAASAGMSNLTVANGPVTSAPFPIQVGVSNPTVSPSAARRFLEQAGFGPTPADAAHVQTIGFQAWLTEQFNMPVISNYTPLLNTSQGGMPTYFLANAVTNADQLRQKVAFALSQIFVTSITKIIWNGDMVPYEQLLIGDAFTNYRQILGDVTLSPCMGEYLDMANNAKANPSAGTAANENYAREIMQLMSIGEKLLNPDGTLQLDSSGNYIPTYGQTNVTELARVFTGWTYPPTTVGGAVNFPSYINSANGPMVPYSGQHDFGSKNLLTGYVAAANLTPAADMSAALDNIANHPNVAPFISKQLIQHLVKSNPTPAYISRVSAAFTQSHGDMKTVITAILLDQEARTNDAGGADQPTDGHLQEPALMLPGFIRAFGGTMTTGNYYSSNMASMNQDIYNAPSVFNYYSPGYVIPGVGVGGPEFQIDNPNNAILRENLVATFFDQYSNPVQSYGPGATVDLTALLPLAATPSTLADALDLTLTHGTMPSAMKTIVVSAIIADNGGNLHRVQTGIYLILTSSYYNVWH